MGLFLGVPAFSVLYTLINEATDLRVREQEREKEKERDTEADGDGNLISLHSDRLRISDPDRIPDFRRRSYQTDQWFGRK